MSWVKLTLTLTFPKWTVIRCSKLVTFEISILCSFPSLMDAQGKREWQIIWTLSGSLLLFFGDCSSSGTVLLFLSCRLAERVAFMHTAVIATVVICRVRNPACTVASALGKERYINCWQEAPLTLCIWRYINEVHLHFHLCDSFFFQ